MVRKRKSSALSATGFGPRLVELRAEAKMSQSELADAVGVSVSTISAIERRLVDPSWSTAVAFADALEVSLDAFRPDESPAPKPSKPKGSA